MNTKTRLILIVALLGISAVVLAVAFVQCEGPLAPATTPPPAAASSGTTDIGTTPGATASPGETAVPATPGATAATTPPDGAIVEPSTTTATPAPTPTPTEGEKAAAAVGQEYTAYRPTKAECNRAVEGGELESCVAPDSIQLVTRPEWEQLFPITDFYVIGLAGRNQNELYDYGYYRELAAWQDSQRYTAKTFDRLLAANGITITDGNRELVAKAFALMTISDYLEEEIVFSDWEEGSWPGSFDWRYNYSLKAWTKIQGLKIRWWFIFQDDRLRVTDGAAIEHQVGDYIDVPFTKLSPPSRDTFTYNYWGR